jgi:hypothetical protein
MHTGILQKNTGRCAPRDHCYDLSSEKRNLSVLRRNEKAAINSPSFLDAFPYPDTDETHSPIENRAVPLAGRHVSALIFRRQAASIGAEKRPDRHDGYHLLRQRLANGYGTAQDGYGMI